MNKMFDNLIATLENVGIKKGDVLYVSSDINVLIYGAISNKYINDFNEEDILLNDFVDTLYDTVGDNGTILFPVFSWDFCRGKGFDYYKTKGEVGALSNWVLKNRKDFVRTQHALYSFMVKGKMAKDFANMSYQDAWGQASIFTYFKDHNSKQLLFNIEAFQGLTFGHYVEQCVDVPYRHPKYFIDKYKDANGMEEVRMYSMYVRDIDISSACGIYNKFLIDNNVAKQTEWQNNKLTVVELGKSYPIIENDMLNNGGKNTLKFENYDFSWTNKKTINYEISDINKLYS